MDINRVYFLRHGENEWNSMDLFCSWEDCDLSDKGIYDTVLLTSQAFLNHNVTNFDIAFTSLIKCSIKTLEIITNSLHIPNIEIKSDWHLNGRHYGALTGFNKKQMVKIYGDNMVYLWRKKMDITPPEMTPTHAYYNTTRLNPKFQDIPEKDHLTTESLEQCSKRVISYWENCIVPEIKNKKRILIISHDSALRTLINHIEEGLTKEEFMALKVYKSIPFYYEFDIKTMKKVGEIKPLANYADLRNIRIPR